MHTVFRNLPINKKLLVTYLSVFFVTSSLGNSVLYSMVRHTIERNIEQELKNTTNMILNMVHTAARVSIRNNLRAAAEQNREIVGRIFQKQLQGNLTESQAKAQAREILTGQSIGKTGYIYCVDSRGAAVVHPKPGMEGGVFLEQGFVKEQILRKEGYLEYEWRNPGEPAKRPKALYMTYFAPWDWIISVSSYRTEFAELIDVSDFRDSILSLKFGETGYSFVIDSKGQMIIHPVIEGNAFAFADTSGRKFIRTIIEEKKGKKIYSWKNPGEQVHRDKLVIFNYIPEYDWIVASSCYLEESYAPLKKVLNVVLATTAATLLITIPITWLMSLYIVRPLKTMMKNFRRGASGDLSIRLDISTEDEMGQLAGYFNYFMEKLEYSNAILTNEILDRQRVEARLRISEEKYRTILERMEEGYYEVDTQGRFTFFNAALQAILGYPKAVLNSLSLREISDPETYRKIKETFREIRTSGKAQKAASYQLNRRDGSTCYLETSISLMVDADRQVIGYRGVLKDISEKRLADLELRRSVEMFSKAFRSSPAGMFIVTINDGRFVDVNDSFLRYTAFSAEDVIGRSLTETQFFIPEEKNELIVARLQQEYAIRNMEINFRADGDHCRMGILSAEMLILQGSKCMLAALEDVTEARQLEREVLDISERERQRIGFTLHDDLCPHLLGVEVLSNVLRQKLAERSSPESINAAKIQGLIQESIIKLKRLSRGLYPVDLSGYDFDTAIADLVMQAQDIFGVSCHFLCELPICLNDDTMARHVYCITHEAIHNALKHANAENIFVVLNMENEKIILTIKDDGRGIHADEPNHGMGMRIMNYRARRIGAEFTVESDMGMGTTITIEIEQTKQSGGGQKVR
ncbi:cache domain-containing protein [Desulfosarcina alkanivorans]|nr:cache domain-containing protein [Desulfosarcina alkanivorans]